MLLPRSRRLLVCLIVLVGADLSAGASRARAYSDLFRFNDPAIEGGGGGRWFTGSPADGYTCGVCHAGEAASQIVVRGLPERYELGTTYEIYVEWPAAMLNVTALVEITDPQGLGAGTASATSLTPSAAEICQPVEAGVPAALLFSAPELNLAGGRQLVGMQDCGGNLLHWQWTAPVQDSGPLIFAGGLVAPDQRKNAEGDQTVELFRSIGSPSDAVHVSQLHGGCSAVTRPAGNLRSSAGVIALWGVVFLVRRHHRGLQRSPKVRQNLPGQRTCTT